MYAVKLLVCFGIVALWHVIWQATQRMYWKIKNSLYFRSKIYFVYVLCCKTNNTKSGPISFTCVSYIATCLKYLQNLCQKLIESSV